MAGEEVRGLRLLEAAFGRSWTARRRPVEIAALLVALRTKGETVGEIVGAARALRARAEKGAAPSIRAAVDTCGTGGDARHLQHLDHASASWWPARACPSRSTATARPASKLGELRRARGAGGAASTSTGRDLRRILAGGRDRRLLRAHGPSGHAARGAGARGARHPHADELPRSAPEPARRALPAGRRLRAGAGGAARRALGALGAEAGPGGARLRRPRRDHDDRHHPRGAPRWGRGRAASRSTPASSGCPSRDPRPTWPAATPRRTPRSCGVCSRGEPGPRRDIVPCSTPPRRSGWARRRRTWAGLALRGERASTRAPPAKLEALVEAQPRGGARDDPRRDPGAQAPRGRRGQGRAARRDGDGRARRGMEAPTRGLPARARRRPTRRP